MGLYWLMIELQTESNETRVGWSYGHGLILKEGKCIHIRKLEGKGSVDGRGERCDRDTHSPDNSRPPNVIVSHGHILTLPSRSDLSRAPDCATAHVRRGAGRAARGERGE